MSNYDEKNIPASKDAMTDAQKDHLERLNNELQDEIYNAKQAKLMDASEPPQLEVNKLKLELEGLQREHDALKESFLHEKGERLAAEEDLRMVSAGSEARIKDLQDASASKNNKIAALQSELRLEKQATFSACQQFRQADSRAAKAAEYSTELEAQIQSMQKESDDALDAALEEIDDLKARLKRDLWIDGLTWITLLVAVIGVIAISFKQ